MSAQTAQFSGVGIPLDVWNPVGPWLESVASGALDDQAPDFADVTCQWQHETGCLLGSTTPPGRSLRLNLTSSALLASIDMPEGSDMWEALMTRGDLQGWSPGFLALENIYGTDVTGDQPTRTITSMFLVELSVVAVPAYRQTTLIQTRRRSARTADVGARREPGLYLTAAQGKALADQHRRRMAGAKATPTTLVGVKGSGRRHPDADLVARRLRELDRLRMTPADAAMLAAARQRIFAAEAESWRGAAR